jgi:pimeloyl-ACP methyl ester carboxylesterase
MDKTLSRFALVWTIAFFLGSPLASAQGETDQVRGVELVAAINLPEKDVKGEGILFLPRKVDRVRALVVVIRYGLGGSAVYLDPPWRRLSETLDTGLLLFRVSTISSESTARVFNDARLGGGESLVLIVQRFAKEFGHPEIADAPLLFWGHSSAGPFGTTFAATYPERTIAFIRYHSGDVSADLGTVSRIPALFLMGAKDTSFPQAAVAAEKLWKSGRSQRAPWTWAIEPDATHGDMTDVQKANALVIPWVTAVLRQRLSPNGDALRVVTEDSGWLGNNQTGEAVTHSAFTSSKEAASWLPDEQTARGWQVVIGASRK